MELWKNSKYLNCFGLVVLLKESGSEFQYLAAAYLSGLRQYVLVVLDFGKTNTFVPRGISAESFSFLGGGMPTYQKARLGVRDFQQELIAPDLRISGCLSFTRANHSVHGVGKCFEKFRTGKCRPGMAFTIGKNLFHFPEKWLRRPETGIKDDFEGKEQEFPFGLFSVASENFKLGRPKKSLSIRFPTGCPGKVL